MLYQNAIDEFAAAAEEIIREKLTGIYLHGSLAMGCFNPDKSDIDLIIIIEENISDEQKMGFMKLLQKCRAKTTPTVFLRMYGTQKRKFCSSLYI